MHAGHADKKLIFRIPNIRLYIAFGVFFNSRFYYPVFTVMYLDYGLTIAQFALLNAAWAATIVASEVPSGALADVFGRRRLLVFAGVVMIIELSLIAFVPRGNLNLLFAVFLANRILSGIAEAAASGADEALAYDSLKSEGLEHHWGRVLDMKTRFQSAGFILAAITGAAVYDPGLVQYFFSLAKTDIQVTRDMTLRLPVFLTLLLGGATLFSAMKMKEPEPESGMPAHENISVRKAFSLTLHAGGWILKTPMALVIIATGLVFDSIIRIVITLTSQYYRMIELPEASFGLIGALIAGLGLFIPSIAFRMSCTLPPVRNFIVMFLVTITGLAGMAFFFPYAGLIFAVILFSGMFLNSFFVSHYLNRITDSAHRATVLSFRGLFYNLSYGLIGILYSFLLSFSRQNREELQPGISPDMLDDLVFSDTFIWFPWFFVAAAAVLVLFSFTVLKKTKSFSLVTEVDECMK